MSVVKKIQGRVNRLRTEQNLNARFTRGPSRARIGHAVAYEGKTYLGKRVGRGSALARKNLASVIKTSRKFSKMAGRDTKGGKNLTARYGGAKDFL